jgi:glyoxylase-like metal-dependent hydrolase (beta-lactamase superfamily II)
VKKTTDKMTSDRVKFDNYESTIQDAFEEPLHAFQKANPPPGSLISQTENLLICSACGTQYDVEDTAVLSRCRICDDPRQYVPPTGQAFTRAAEMKRRGYRNQWRQLADDDRFWSIWTEPKFAIGQRAILVKTPLGNILWDCITYLDNETIERINAMGGLAAIVISHPHYYTTHLDWADTFDCPVYLSWEDKEWLNRLDRLGKARTFIEGSEEEIEVRGEGTGVKALKLGGHFPGSLVCLAFGRLLVADTLVTTPSGVGSWDSTKGGRPEGMNTYAFMWSIPNMIPLSPDTIARMWMVLKNHEFKSTHGAFVGTEVWDASGGSSAGVKRRVLESMQIQVQMMGWTTHAFLKEEI